MICPAIQKKGEDGEEGRKRKENESDSAAQGSRPGWGKQRSRIRAWKRRASSDDSSPITLRRTYVMLLTCFFAISYSYGACVHYEVGERLVTVRNGGVESCLCVIVVFFGPVAAVRRPGMSVVGTF